MLAVGAAWCQTAPNPLAPLTAEEIRTAARAVRESGRMPGGALFSTIVLDEPPKDAVLEGRATPRRALAVIYDYRANQTVEAIVDLGARRVASWTPVAGAEPPITSQDSGLADQIVRADPRFRRAMSERGIRDLNRVLIVAWSAGYFALPGTDHDRIVRAVCYYAGAGENFYAHPVEGVFGARGPDVAADSGVLGHRPQCAGIARELRLRRGGAGSGWRRSRLRSPKGRDFRSKTARCAGSTGASATPSIRAKGLVLYTVGFEDGGRVRPILYRASLVGDGGAVRRPDGRVVLPQQLRRRRTGAGNERQPACARAPIARRTARCYDAVVADETGAPETLRGAVALYERDGGIAWKHGDETRRARDLVVSFLTQVGNYEYGFEWIFRQDGSLECRVVLTGIMAVKGVEGHGHDPYSHLVGQNLAAPHHQHFFTFRLDFDVDGPANRVVEMNSQAAPAGPRNPYGNAFTMTGDAARDGARGRAQPEPGDQPQVAGGEPESHQRARAAHGLRAAAGRQRGALRAAGLVDPQTGGVPQLAPLGDAVPGPRSCTPAAIIPTRATAATAW